MANATIKGLAVQAGIAGVVISPAFAIVENLRFTPRYTGPLFEVEDDQGVSKAMALQTDGGDFVLDTVWIDNATAMNLQLLGVNANISFNTKTISNGNNGYLINAFIVSLPEVSFPRKGETKLSFRAAWRPGI